MLLTHVICKLATRSVNTSCNNKLPWCIYRPLAGGQTWSTVTTGMNRGHNCKSVSHNQSNIAGSVTYITFTVQLLPRGIPCMPYTTMWCIPWKYLCQAVCTNANCYQTVIFVSEIRVQWKLFVCRTIKFYIPFQSHAATAYTRGNFYWHRLMIIHVS